MGGTHWFGGESINYDGRSVVMSLSRSVDVIHLQLWGSMSRSAAVRTTVSTNLYPPEWIMMGYLVHQSGSGRKQKTPVSSRVFLCRDRDLNSDSIKYRGILSPLCLPIPPSRQYY